MTSASQVTDDAFVLDGFSKRYAMTGFRLGYVIAPSYAIRTLQIMQQNLFISASRFVQHAGIAALEHGAVHVENMRQTYRGRRDRLVAGLRELGFGIPHLPDGAFYILADCAGLGPAAADSRSLAARLLTEARVGVTPGIDFGEAGEGKLRFCYAVADEVIETALARLAEALPRVLDSPAGTAESGAKESR
jgi:aspartate/methionine/tyrosine aminotransferase